MKQLKVLDLFAGCGGLSLGLQNSGHEIIAACEIDQWASETYQANHSNVEMIQSDIREISTDYWRKNYGGNIDLIAGGPPCQGFSVSGKRQYGEISDRNTLVGEFMKVVEAVQPKFALIENVSGFRTGQFKSGHGVMPFLEAEFSRLGYKIHVQMLQATDFGVPSLRSRIFIFATRCELASSPFPVPGQSSSGLKLVSVDDAISDLPSLAAGQGEEAIQAYTKHSQSEYQDRMRSGAQGVANHVSMKHTQRLVERFSNIPQGGKGYDIGRSDGVDNSVTTVYKSNNQRLTGNRPSLCVTANFQSTYVHPHQDRNLTAREGARLMSFPDTFVFKGKRTQMSSSLLRKYGREHEDYLSQYNQIGNSVPPLLAEAIGNSIGHATYSAMRSIFLASTNNRLIAA